MQDQNLGIYVPFTQPLLYGVAIRWHCSQSFTHTSTDYRNKWNNMQCMPDPPPPLHWSIVGWCVYVALSKLPTLDCWQLSLYTLDLKWNKWPCLKAQHESNQHIPYPNTEIVMANLSVFCSKPSVMKVQVATTLYLEYIYSGIAVSYSENVVITSSELCAMYKLHPMECLQNNMHTFSTTLSQVSHSLGNRGVAPVNWKLCS